MEQWLAVSGRIQSVEPGVQWSSGLVCQSKEQDSGQIFQWHLGAYLVAYTWLGQEVSGVDLPERRATHQAKLPATPQRRWGGKRRKGYALLQRDFGVGNTARCGMQMLCSISTLVVAQCSE